MTLADIPEGFPRGPAPGAVAGAQPKVLLRQVGGRFVSGWTEEELVTRYDVCADFVTQLAEYGRRKLDANPQWGRAGLEIRLAAGIRAKAWGFTEAEIAWMVQRACEGM